MSQYQFASVAAMTQAPVIGGGVAVSHAAALTSFPAPVGVSAGPVPVPSPQSVRHDGAGGGRVLSSTIIEGLGALS